MLAGYSAPTGMKSASKLVKLNVLMVSVAACARNWVKSESFTFQVSLSELI